MTALVAGAASSNAQNWNQSDWNQIRRSVYRIQMRIAKAVQENRWGKVKALQRLLACSIGWVVFGRLKKGLSCMMGNYHVRFLGGEGP